MQGSSCAVLPGVKLFLCPLPFHSACLHCCRVSSAYSLVSTQSETLGAYFLRHVRLEDIQAQLLDEQNQISVRSTEREELHPIGTRVRFQQGEAGQHTGFVSGWSVSLQVCVGCRLGVGDDQHNSNRGHMSGIVTSAWAVVESLVQVIGTSQWLGPR